MEISAASGVAARNASVDYLKLALAVMVVGLHTSMFSRVDPLLVWLTREGLFRLAVPCFLIVNGFYFSRSSRPHAWMGRVLWLYTFWMIVYFPAWLIDSSTGGKLTALFFGYFHLWYLPATLVAAGILLLLKRLTLKTIALAGILVFAVAIAVSYAGQFHVNDKDPVWKLVHHDRFLRNGLLFGFPFFAMGYLIDRFNVIAKADIKLCIWLLAGALMLLMVEAYFARVTAPSRTSMEMPASLVIATPLLFIVAARLSLPGPGKFISKFASGIYFSHVGFFLIFHSLQFSGLPLFFLTLISSMLASSMLIAVTRDRWAIV
jgi:hypothetical protein